MEKEGPHGKNNITKVTTELALVALLGLILAPILGILFSLDTAATLAEPFARLVTYLHMVATVIAMACIAIFMYAFMGLKAIEKKETKKLGVALTWKNERTEKNHRWERVEEYMRSPNASDWKIAILEADNILDEIVERMGYHGTTLGERMKTIEASDFPYLEDTWKAHKIRNDIAHKGGVDYDLSRSLAEETISTYYRVFKELGYL